MRRVAVYSGDRSERGHVDAIKIGIDADPHLESVLIAAPLAHHDDNPASVATAVGLHVQDMTRKLVEAAPDVLVLFGDRSETFAAAIAATYLRIPVAHVEGGDITQGGCPDDVVRNAISALAQVHFTTNAQSAWILGAHHENVHNVGLPILDLAHLRATPDQVRDHFHLDAKRPLVLFCMHPVPGEDVAPAVDALLTIERDMNAQVLCLTPNNDAGSTAVRAAVERHFAIVPNMPQSMFHGLLAIASCFAGNSSAALKEAPYFDCPAVDIGARQRGRLRTVQMEHAILERDDIALSIKIAIGQRHLGRVFTSPYGSGNAGKQIADVLATWEGK